MEKSSAMVKFSFPNQAQIWLEFGLIGEKMNPGGNYGRTALAWPTAEFEKNYSFS